MSRDRFGKVMTTLALAFDKDITPEKISLYWQMLRQYPIDKIEDSAQRIIQTKKYSNFPLVSEFIENIAGDIDNRALLAVENILDAMEFTGGWGNPKFDDPVIPHVISKMGGWIIACEKVAQINQESGNLDFWRNYAIKLYKAIVKQPELPPPPRLMGRHDIENIEKGYLDPKTRMLTLPNGSGIHLPFDDEDLPPMIEEKKDDD